LRFGRGGGLGKAFVNVSRRLPGDGCRHVARLPINRAFGRKQKECNMGINNHIANPGPDGLKPDSKIEDVSDLVVDKLDVEAIWSEWNKAGLQTQRAARPGEANGEG